MASIELLVGGALTPAIQHQAHAIASQWLANTPQLTQMILAGKIGMF